ncbi:Hsp33 family molecular chaperone HslO [Virgibacillus sp. MSP4-1]|uniref:Hsp33 family molecular chaperone HslO n=1 Tax=Virgibacillus sp. MSP4-1 TaxID=2700081 RepID=UPI0005C5FF95|nr:Hsp33 family molecular chaperone HslO [Virgibacillus sp. MSP4-1]QHS24574.1 Hsp33 family molecular chaperone HslO [Virgibacillus sp. MSP4-1]
MSDYLVRATAFDGYVRAFAIQSTETVNEAAGRHDTWATTSAALGRTLSISAMMGAMLKGDDKLTVKVEGNGPVGAIITDANAKGEVRGYVQNPHVDFDLSEKGKLDVRRAVGTEGFISVVKDQGLKDFFTGQTPIVSGEISEDFTYYFVTSEQIPSSVGAGVLVNPDLSILAAGGFIIQVMPGASDEIISQLEERIQQIPSISQLIREGKTPEEILDIILEGGDMKILGTQPVSFQCECSRERLANAITSLGNEEIQDMIEKDNGATATCHFCNEVYEFTADDLQQLKS